MRKAIHGVVTTPNAFPATTLKMISMIATDRPSSTLSIDAIKMENPTMVATSNWSTASSAIRRRSYTVSAALMW